MSPVGRLKRMGIVHYFYDINTTLKKIWKMRMNRLNEMDPRRVSNTRIQEFKGRSPSIPLCFKSMNDDGLIFRQLK